VPDRLLKTLVFCLTRGPFELKCKQVMTYKTHRSTHKSRQEKKTMKEEKDLGRRWLGCPSEGGFRVVLRVGAASLLW